MTKSRQGNGKSFDSSKAPAAPRRAWVRPELRRMSAGDAEFGGAVGSDGPISQS